MLALERAMKWRLYKCAVLACVAMGQAAQACNVDGYEPPDVRDADVVVVGTIANYRLIPNPGYAERVRTRVDSRAGQGPPPVISGFLPGRFYGKFEVTVDKVLKGKVERRFSATFRPWTPCCYGSNVKEVLPEQLQSRRYLIALDDPPTVSQFGQSADSNVLTMHINICIGAFFMKLPDADWFVKDAERYLAKHKYDLPKR
jgi:hypothetical protein